MRLDWNERRGREGGGEGGEGKGRSRQGLWAIVKSWASLSTARAMEGSKQRRGVP